MDTLDDLPKLNTPLSLPFSGKLRLDAECAGGQSDEQLYPEAWGLLGMISLLLSGYVRTFSSLGLGCLWRRWQVLWQLLWHHEEMGWVWMRRTSGLAHVQFPISNSSSCFFIQPFDKHLLNRRDVPSLAVCTGNSQQEHS